MEVLASIVLKHNVCLNSCVCVAHLCFVCVLRGVQRKREDRKYPVQVPRIVKTHCGWVRDWRNTSSLSAMKRAHYVGNGLLHRSACLEAAETRNVFGSEGN